MAKPNNAPASPIRKARSVSNGDKVLLYALAAGRCSFRLCNDNIVEHHLTRDAGNYGEAAHIYAFSEDGPRGKAPGRPDDPDTLENLILLCPKCHKLVDDNPDAYPVADLREYRKIHEERIRRVANLAPERHALALHLVARIAGQPSTIPKEHVADAIRSRYLAAHPFVIEHALGPEEDPATIEQAARHVSEHFAAFQTIHGRHDAPPVGVFGIAPIPLLMHLGWLLGNKSWADLYQRHRDTGDWTWKTDGEPVRFDAKKVRDGRADLVAFLVNVSGRNALERLPDAYADGTVYELAPVGREPDRTLVRRREDLDAFRSAYRAGLDEIRRGHRDLSELGVFPAVPIPFAIAMGTELLPKADPALAVHDWRKDRFIRVIKINT
jgi:hypothetical protein